MVTPALVRAAVSPTALTAAAAGAGIGVVDHSVVVAVVLAAGGWLGRMAAAVVAGRRRERAARPAPAQLDPWSVPEPWRGLFQQANGLQARFDRVVGEWPAGPIRDHLCQLQPRVWAEVASLGALGRQGAAAAGWNGASVDQAGSDARLSEELRRVQAERAALPEGATGRIGELDRREEALAARLQARDRAHRAASALADRVALAVGRLDRTVTDLIEMRAATGDAFDGMGGETASALDRLGDEVASLRAAMAETSGAPPDPARS